MGKPARRKRLLLLIMDLFSPSTFPQLAYSLTPLLSRMSEQVVYKIIN